MKFQRADERERDRYRRSFKSCKSFPHLFTWDESRHRWNETKRNGTFLAGGRNRWSSDEWTLACQRESCCNIRGTNEMASWDVATTAPSPWRRLHFHSAITRRVFRSVDAHWLWKTGEAEAFLYETLCRHLGRHQENDSWTPFPSAKLILGQTSKQRNTRLLQYSIRCAARWHTWPASICTLHSRHTNGQRNSL